MPSHTHPESSTMPSAPPSRPLPVFARASTWALCLAFGVPALGGCLLAAAMTLGGCSGPSEGGMKCPPGISQVFVPVLYAGTLMLSSIVLAPVVLIGGFMVAAARREKW